MNNKTLKGLALSLSLLTTAPFALAEKTPDGGAFDYRVRRVDFVAMQVYRVTGHYGYHTDIQFADNEIVTDIAIGDKDAWSIGPVRNHVFIKPKADKAHTNMTVLTNKRSYYFVLDAHKTRTKDKPNDMYFAVKFQYPEIRRQMLLEEERKKELAEKLDEKPKLEQRNYAVKGSRTLQPTEAWNDRRFTYMRFSPNQPMPAVFLTNPDGSESLLNSHVEGDSNDIIAVHVVARKLILRKGNSVTCLFNLAVNRPVLMNPNRTMSPSVKRKITSEPTGKTQPLAEPAPPPAASPSAGKPPQAANVTVVPDVQDMPDVQDKGQKALIDKLQNFKDSLQELKDVQGEQGGVK